MGAHTYFSSSPSCDRALAPPCLRPRAAVPMPCRHVRLNPSIIAISLRSPFRVPTRSVATATAHSTRARAPPLPPYYPNLSHHGSSPPLSWSFHRPHR